MIPIRVHFVCRGNALRSRVAEAYARLLVGDRWIISSSGIDQQLTPDQGLSAWAKIVGHQHGFDLQFSQTAVQTTTDILKTQDIIIFLSKDVFRDANNVYAFQPARTRTWKIKDRGDWRPNLTLHQKRNRMFKHIKRQVQQLVIDIEHGGWVDIVDEENKPLDIRLPISIANKNGQWHRVCHAIITTPSGQTLVQKRSSHIFFAPGLLDISVGGHVDSGETPEVAMVREIYEEVGLQVKTKELTYLGIFKQASYHPRYKRYTKGFVYTYHMRTQQASPKLILQKSEVASARFITKRQLARLIKRHSLRGLGRLNYSYRYYEDITHLIR